MSPQTAIELINGVFTSHFSIENYTLFLRNLLGSYEEEAGHEWLQEMELPDGPVTRYRSIGVYTDPDGNELSLLVMEVADATMLEKGRDRLRHFIAGQLNSRRRYFALAALYSQSDEGADWRFSFVRPALEDHPHNQQKLPSAYSLLPVQQSSFPVGKQAQPYSIQKLLLPLLGRGQYALSVNDLGNCFRVEKINADFFEHYRKLYLLLTDFLASDAAAEKACSATNTDPGKFAGKLLSQLLLLYFLRKKDWLDLPVNAAPVKDNTGFLQPAFEEAAGKGDNFYIGYLRALLQKTWAKAGFPTGEMDWPGPGIIIPNRFFSNREDGKETGILDIFSRYNFTIREEEPLEKEMAVDPGMLGNVLENMLQLTERKNKGAFYTPRGIVHFMCRQSLAYFLYNAVHDAIPGTGLSREAIECFIRQGEIATGIKPPAESDHDPASALPDGIARHAELLDEYLTGIRVCDPAVGSGAFPMGLLHELVTAQELLLPFLGKDYLDRKLETLAPAVEDRQNTRSAYRFLLKQQAIRHSIYGLDIDASAVDISRIRLWLSLVVDNEDNDAFPGLAHTIIRGNSLKAPAGKALGKPEQKGNDGGLFFPEVWQHKNGFDIVIGNPPYISYYGNNGQAADSPTRDYFKQQYQQVKRTRDRINSMNLMTERGLQLLNPNGVLSFITNKTLAVLPSYARFRAYILQNHSLDYIVTGLDPFNAVVDCVLLGVSRKKKEQQLRFYRGQLVESTGIHQDIFLKNPWQEFHCSDNLRLVEKIEVHKGRLGDMLTINRGVNIGGFFPCFLSKEKKDGFYPYLPGARNIKKHFYTWHPHNGYFRFDPEKEKVLRSKGATIVLGNAERYLRPRLFIPESGQTLMAAYCEERIYGSYGLLIGTATDRIALKCACALLNSELLSYYAIEKGILRKGRKATPHVGVKGLKQVPLPALREEMILALAGLIDCLLFPESADPGQQKPLLVQLINALVYEWYLPEEMAAAGIGILKHLPDPGLPNNNYQPEIFTATLQSILSASAEHPLRRQVEALYMLKEVRYIRGMLEEHLH